MKSIKSIILILLITLPVSLMAIPVIEEPTVVNGTCLNNASITVNTSSLGNNPTYGLKGKNGEIQEIRSQLSNFFPGLPAGTYIISVYDNTVGSSPVTREVAVTTSYKTFSINVPVATSAVCAGSLRLSVKGGSYPYTYRIKNATTNEERPEWEVVSNSTYMTFSDLPAGSYYCEILDKCGELRVAQPSPSTTIESGSLVGVTFDTFELMGSSSTIRGRSGCNDIQFWMYVSNYRINGSSSIPNTSYNVSTIQYRVEYPVGSGIYTSWVTGNNNHVGAGLANYDPKNPGKYRLEVKHPCTDVITKSPIYDMPGVILNFSSANYFIYDNFCDLPTKNSHRISLSTSGIYDYVCGDYDIVVTPANGGESKEYKWTSGTYYDIRDLDISTKYNVVIKQGGNIVKSYETTTRTPIRPAESTFSYDYGYNYGTTCDFSTGKITTSYTGDYYTYGININRSNPITYSIVEGPVMRDPITITSGSSGNLWDNLPYGEYKIKTDYNGCREQIHTYTLRKLVNSFAAKVPTFTPSAVCGKYTLNIQGYFTNTSDQPITNSSTTYRYYVLLTNLNTGATTTSTNLYSNYISEMLNLDPGRYKLQYYSYYSKLPRCYYLEQEIILPEYIPPTLNLPLSGGITCGVEEGTLTITAFGDSQPFEYRYKNGSDVTTTDGYSQWQDGSVFSGLKSGDYTVQIANTCGDATTQPIRIYSGTEQFVTLVGSFDKNTVCQGKTGLVSVLSIGPVESYQWYKDDILIDGADGESYEITDMQEEDSGVYKVVVNTGAGGCELSSSIPVKMLPVIGTGNDSITVIPFEERIFDVFENDNIGLCAPQSCEQILVPSKIQVEGYSAGVLEGKFGKIEIVDNKIKYTAPAAFTDGIVRFTYAVECEDNNVTYTDKGEVAIFILQSCSQSTVCEGDDFTVCFEDYPANKTDFVVTDNGVTLPLPASFYNMTTDKVLEVTPVVDDKEFPTIDFTIYVVNTDRSKVRWKGTVDHSWHNPRNWVLVNTDETDGNVIKWTPTNCVNAEIPSKSPRYPSLDIRGSINHLYMKDRALLGANYKLTYTSVRMDLKLDTDEKNRWIMYSAPLTDMYSGDFMLRKDFARVVEEGSYMRFYQSGHPDENSSAIAKSTTRTFGNLEQSLPLGKALFLKVDPSKDNSTYFAFPKDDEKYAYYQLNDWSNTYPSIVETEHLDRTKIGRFITDDVSFDLDYSFTMTPLDDMVDSEVVMISNPFPAYLNIKKFLDGNNNLEQGYLIWEGVEDSLMKYNEGQGNRWTIEDVDAIKNNVPSDNDQIAPYQSFFVVKKNIGSKITVKFNPEEMTTVVPSGTTEDYKLK